MIMYQVVISITIRPLRLKPSYRQELANRVAELRRILGIYLLESDVKEFWFHPDEESEYTGFEVEGAEIVFRRECRLRKSIFHLTQIVLSTAALFDSERWAYLAEIKD